MTESGGKGAVAPPVVRSIDAAGGVALLYRAWEVDRPRARIRIVHGLGEHSGRYAPIAGALVERGFSCYAGDLRGHGVSGGRRGHVARFDEYLDDLHRLTIATAGNEPSFLFGHSLGGLIAVRAMQSGSAGTLSGAVLSAPALDLAGPLPWWRDPAVALLSRLAPTLPLPNGIDPDDLSHDPAAVTAYRTDPLVHDRITPRLYSEMKRAMRTAAAEAGKVRVPVLLLAPGEDRITDVDSAVWIVERFYGEVRVRTYPQLYHEPLHEEERGSILGDVVEWIEQRLP